VNLATVPGLAGLALTETAPPGYGQFKTLGGPMIGWWAVLRDGGDFGYTPEMRLAFLRREGYDPLDLSVSGTEMLSNGGARLPFFPDKGVISGDNDEDAPVTHWARFRREKNAQFLSALYAALRKQAPILPLVMAERSGDATFGPKFWASWESAKSLPCDTQDDAKNIPSKDPHAVHKTVYQPVVVPEGPIVDSVNSLYSSLVFGILQERPFPWKPDFFIIDFRGNSPSKIRRFYGFRSNRSRREDRIGRATFKMLLYIIRHADPDYPNNTITPQGHLEAKALAERLAGEGLTRIYSSPLGRAQDTARYTAEATGLTPVILSWTCELKTPAVDHGPYGRLAPFNLAGEIIRADLEASRSHDGVLRYPYIGDGPIAECAQAVRDESDAFLATLGYAREGGLYRCVQPNRERIALFCHGGFGGVLLSHLLEIPLPLIWSGLWLAPSSVTTVFFEQRSETWAVPRAMAIGRYGSSVPRGLPVQSRGVIAQNWDGADTVAPSSL
jgi:probable phosphoglycerate mutase